MAKNFIWIETNIFFLQLFPSGYNDIVTVLLEQGALVSATDHNSSTPLHLACQKGHQKCTVSERGREEGGGDEKRKWCAFKYM